MLPLQHSWRFLQHWCIGEKAQGNRELLSIIVYNWHASILAGLKMMRSKHLFPAVDNISGGWCIHDSSTELQFFVKKIHIYGKLFLRSGRIMLLLYAKLEDQLGWLFDRKFHGQNRKQLNVSNSFRALNKEFLEEGEIGPITVHQSDYKQNI